MRAAAWAVLITLQVALVLLFSLIAWIEWVGPLEVREAKVEPMSGWHSRAFATAIWVSMVSGLVASVVLASGEISRACR